DRPAQSSLCRIPKLRERTYKLLLDVFAPLDCGVHGDGRAVGADIWTTCRLAFEPRFRRGQDPSNRDTLAVGDSSRRRWNRVAVDAERRLWGAQLSALPARDNPWLRAVAERASIG